MGEETKMSQMKGLQGKCESLAETGEHKSEVVPILKVAWHFQHCFVAIEVEKAGGWTDIWLKVAEQVEKKDSGVKE